MTLEKRRVAIEGTIARFSGRRFAWGTHDCARLAYYHMRQMGHRPAALPQYRSAIGARGALAKLGHAGLVEALDAMLPAIPPAAAWPGDLVALNGDVFEAIAVVVGNGRVLCWSEGVDVPVIFQPTAYLGAWRL